MTVSTHVLDADSGEPARGIPVTLTDADGASIASATTDGDGRAQLAAGALPAGTYRLRFDVATPFYPEITIAFRIAEPAAKHHVPLLLSRYSYTTYRGS